MCNFMHICVSLCPIFWVISFIVFWALQWDTLTQFFTETFRIPDSPRQEYEAGSEL